MGICGYEDLIIWVFVGMRIYCGGGDVGVGVGGDVGVGVGVGVAVGVGVSVVLVRNLFFSSII